MDPMVRFPDAQQVPPQKNLKFLSWHVTVFWPIFGFLSDFQTHTHIFKLHSGKVTNSAFSIDFSWQTRLKNGSRTISVDGFVWD